MFSVSIERSPSYLIARASGPADVQESCSGIVFVAEMLRRISSPRLLFDVTALIPKFAGPGALEVISTLYNSMPPMEKIAIVAPTGTAHGLVLEVARHRNVPAVEFANEGDADTWLRA